MASRQSSGGQAAKQEDAIVEDGHGEDAQMQGEEQQSQKKEGALAQYNVKAAMSALKEIRRVLEEANNAVEEGSTLRQALEQKLKALDADIEKLAVTQQKPLPDTAYTKCVQQLEVATYQRDWKLKEVERVQK